MKILRRIACGVFALGIVLALAVPARSDVPLVSYKSLYTGSGTRTGPVIILSGQNTCTVTTSGGASGYTVTVKGSSVGSGTLTTLTQFGSSGAITTDSANAGNLTGTVVALTNFTYVVTGTITGTLTIVETCSSAGSSPVSGTITGTVTANQGTSPWVVTTPIPGPTSSPGSAPLVVLANPSAVPLASATAGADTVSNTQTAPFVFALCSLFNGASWDRCRAVSVGNDATGPNNNAAFSAAAFNYLFNGTNFDRMIVCPNVATVNISTATTTEIVATSGTKKVYVCGYSLYIVSGTTPSFQFETGTKVTTACDTTPAALGGTFGGIAAAVGQLFNSPASGQSPVLRTAASSELCIVSGGTNPNIQGFVTYAQF